MYVVLAMLLQAASSTQPDVQVVLEGMFVRAERDARRQIAGSSWTKSRTDEDITDPERPKTEHRERYRVWGDGTRMLQLKTWRDNKRVSIKPQPLPLFIDRGFLEQFEYAFAEPALVPCDGGECWRLSFTPKEGVFTDGDLEQVLLGSASGTMLVETVGFGILRADAHTIQPYRSFVVDVYWYSVSLTQVPVDGAMVTATIEISYAFNPILGGPKTKRRFYEYADVTLPPSR